MHFCPNIIPISLVAHCQKYGVVHTAAVWCQDPVISDYFCKCSECIEKQRQSSFINSLLEDQCLRRAGQSRVSILVQLGLTIKAVIKQLANI